jgi:hypothetical protein
MLTKSQIAKQKLGLRRTLQQNQGQELSLEDEVQRYLAIQVLPDIDIISFWQVSILYLYYIDLLLSDSRITKNNFPPYLSLPWIFSPFKLLLCPVRGYSPQARKQQHLEETSLSLILLRPYNF